MNSCRAMTDITLEKRPGCFVPATLQDEQKLDRIKIGDCITVPFKAKRNGQFHKKFFALLEYAFSIWEPEEGLPEKNFERFRKDITILAGYYHEVPRIDGTTRVTAKSISFAKMDEDEFSLLYESTITTLLKFVLKNYTRDDINRVLNNVAEFA